MNFGDNLRNLRRSKTLSQEELAECVNVSRQSVSKWETGILLYKWHRNYFDVNTIVFTIFPFKNKKFSLKIKYLYIPNSLFVYTLRKCEICDGVRKIEKKSLFIRFLIFRGVFSYPVVIYSR